MARRTPEARFMGGAWVFPGGAVDETDGSEAAHDAVQSADPELLVWRAAAVRELLEETGVWMLTSGAVVTERRPADDSLFAATLAEGDRFAGDSLFYFANWITPAPLPVRFDTRFFVASAPADLDPIVDGIEVVDAAWIHPGDALDRASTGQWEVAFPTRRILEFLGGFASVADLLEEVVSQSAVPVIQPRLSIIAGKVEVLMPGEPGFDEAAAEEADPAFLEAARRIAGSGTDTLPEVAPP